MAREIEIVTGANRDLVTFLSNAGARFFVFGGTATRFWAPGRRAPEDLDLMLEPSAAMLVTINRALGSVGEPPIIATPEEFTRGNRGAPFKGPAHSLNADLLTPPTGVDFAEHWATAEEATMNLTSVPVRVGSIDTLELLLGIGLEREPARAKSISEDLAWLARARRARGRGGP